MSTNLAKVILSTVLVVFAGVAIHAHWHVAWPMVAFFFIFCVLSADD